MGEGWPLSGLGLCLRAGLVSPKTRVLQVLVLVSKVRVLFWDPSRSPKIEVSGRAKDPKLGALRGVGLCGCRLALLYTGLREGLITGKQYFKAKGSAL